MDALWVDTIAGGVGGCLGVLAGSPLDVVRVRLQQSNSPAHTSIFSLLRNTVNQEGPFSLFRGLFFPLAFAAAQNALAFQSFGLFLRRWRSSKDDPEQVEEGARKETFYNDQYGVFFAGCFAGGVQCIVTVPQEGLKIKQQLQHVSAGQEGYTGPLQLLRRLGVTGAYHGTGITLARDIPSFGAYFIVYKTLTDRWEEWNSIMQPLWQPMWQSTLLQGIPGDSMKELVSGGVAGVAAWGLVYPLDVLKSRVQARGCSLWTVWSELVASRDMSALSRGMGATLARAWLVNAAIFWGYARTESLILGWRRTECMNDNS